MVDPLSPISGLLPRLALAMALSVVVWCGVAWALLT